MADTGREEAAHIPPGRHELSREFVVAHQRRRLTDAIAELCAEQGYRKTSVSEIVKRARASRTTFYANFDGKEDCFLAAFDAACQEATELARTVDGDSWPERVRAVLASLLEYVAAHPAYAHLCLVEAPAAGDEAAARYEGMIQHLAERLRAGRQEVERGIELPNSLEETLVGGVVWMLHQRLSRKESSMVVELLPELVEFVLTPYVGRDRAQEVAGASRAGEPLS
jgi:AcrR family transcriptional regulator